MKIGPVLRNRYLRSIPGLFLSILCVLAHSPWAQQAPEAVSLTMEASISRGLSQNNQLRSSEFAAQKARWDRKHAWTRLFPTLSLNSRITRIDARTFSERDFRGYLPAELAGQIPQTVFRTSYYTSLDVSLPLFNGALLNGLSLSGISEKMADQMHRSTRDRIVFQVIASYLGVLKSREVLRLQRDYLELSRLNYEKAGRLHDAGRYSRTEVLRWKVDYQQQKSVVVGSESALRSALALLARLLNIDGDVDIEGLIPGPLLAESEELARLSDDEILGFIRLSDSELIRANAALSAAKSGEKVGRLTYRHAYAAYLPNVSLSYSHAWRENNTFALDDYSPRTLMVHLSMPLFSSFQNLTSVRSAGYSYRQSREQFADQLRNTRYLLTETVNRAINLKTQRELSRANVEYSEHNYRIVAQQKEQGLVSNIEFIDAKLNLQNAKLNDITTHYDFVSAMVELYYLLGKLESISETI